MRETICQTGTFGLMEKKSLWNLRSIVAKPSEIANRKERALINSIQKLLYILGTISPYSMIASACYGGQVSVEKCKQWLADMEVSERAINTGEILNYFIDSVPFVSWFFIVISAILLIYHLCFLRIANKRLAPMDFFQRQLLKKMMILQKDLE